LTLSAEKNKTTGGDSSLILTAEEIKDLKARINERQKASMVKMYINLFLMLPLFYSQYYLYGIKSK